MTKVIVLTPDPSGQGYRYVARMASGGFKWGRLGEAVRFTDEKTARTALAGMNGWGWEPLIKAARIMRVGEAA